MASFKTQLEQLEAFEPDAIKAAIKAVQKETRHSISAQSLKTAEVTTGQTHGPELRI